LKTQVLGLFRGIGNYLLEQSRVSDGDCRHADEPEHEVDGTASQTDDEEDTEEDPEKEGTTN